MFESRNKAVGLSQRTWKNLELARKVRHVDKDNYDFHVVTQLLNSLLGLAIVPWAKHKDHKVWKVSLAELEEKGWPTWRFSKRCKKTTTLRDLLRHLRNAAAHGRYRFTGEVDSRCLSKVTLVVTDSPEEGKPINWRAEIGGEDLYRFCQLLAERLERMEHQAADHGALAGYNDSQ